MIRAAKWVVRAMLNLLFLVMLIIETVVVMLRLIFKHGVNFPRFVVLLTYQCNDCEENHGHLITVEDMLGMERGEYLSTCRLVVSSRAHVTFTESGVILEDERPVEETKEETTFH